MSIIPKPSLPGAVHHRSTCTETNYIPVTVARAGWCSTSSLLQVRPGEKCPPSPGSPSPAKLSPSTKTRPGTAPAATGRNQATPCSQTFAFVPYAQHHWLAYLNSHQRQRTTAPQHLFRPSYYVRHNTAVNSPRPPTPPVYHHCVLQDLYPRETLV